MIAYTVGLHGRTNYEIPTAWTHNERLSVYASVRAGSAQAPVIVVLNKATTTTTLALTLAHHMAHGTLDVYQLSGGASQIMHGTSVTATALNAFHLEVPALSVSVLVPH
jgi:hypothetical protein